jgi:hypothetical protein
MKTLIRLCLPHPQLMQQPQPLNRVTVPKVAGPAVALILDCCVFLCAIGVVVYHVVAAEAASYYVSQASNANDTNTCLVAAPCRTITRACWWLSLLAMLSL